MERKLTVAEAAAAIGVSESLLYEWCSEGVLAHYRFGKPGRRGKILIAETDLNGFVAAHRQETKPEAPPLKHIRTNHG
jgi:excisionase family DNA binding protein